MTQKRDLSVALIGDFDKEIVAHQCIPNALKISGQAQDLAIHSEWLPTTELSKIGKTELATFDGFWCVPGSPYKDRQAVLDIIRSIRDSKKPFLGTCGGFQHAILEFAINKLGVSEAGHEEDNPNAEMNLIFALSCRLSDKHQEINLSIDSKLHSIFNADLISEEYNCGFGLNPRYLNIFENSPLRFVAFNDEGLPQAFELSTHPFFIGTAFQPERSARQNLNHPLVSAFVNKISQIL